MTQRDCECGHRMAAHAFFSDSCTSVGCRCPLYVPAKVAVAERERTMRDTMLATHTVTSGHILDRVRDELLAHPVGAELTGDDAYAAYQRGPFFDPTRNASFLGGVFKHPGFTFTGEWRNSARAGNHARALRVWRRV